MLGDGARRIGRFDLIFPFLGVEKWGLAEQIPFYSIVIGILCFFAASYQGCGRANGKM